MKTYWSIDGPSKGHKGKPCYAFVKSRLSVTKQTAKLVRRYGKNEAGKSILAEELTDEEIAMAMSPVKMANAAFIREVVERAKLAAVSHADEKLVVKKDDLSIAATSMKPHLRLVCPELADAAEKAEIEEMMSGEQIDPMSFALDIIGDELVHKIFNSLADPGVLKKIVLKQKKRSPFGSKPSMN